MKAVNVSYGLFCCSEELQEKACPFDVVKVEPLTGLCLSLLSISPGYHPKL